MSVWENVISPPLPLSREEDAAERRIPKTLSDAAARLVDSLKINSVSEKVRRGRTVVIKRRPANKEPFADVGNVYFCMRRLSSRFSVEKRAWRRWGEKDFLML